MGTPEAITPPGDRIRWTAEFASPEREAAYRRAYARQDQFLGRVIVWVSAAAVASIAVIDYQLVPPGPALYGLWAARAAFLVVSAAALARLRTPSGPAAFDREFAAWYVLTVALHAYVGAVWPAGHVEMRVTAAFAVITSYCVMPLRLRMQAAGAMLHTAASLAVSSGINPHGDATAFFADVLWLAVVNVLGVFLAYRVHARQRLLFAALERQSELAAGLAQALAEVRTLRGLLRVCAWCRKVDADGTWQQLEAYVRDHSYAEFTHGMCPTCLAAAVNS